MQLNCIKQLNDLIEHAVSAKKHLPMPNFIKACRKEIEQRKHWFNHPEEVQV